MNLNIETSINYKIKLRNDVLKSTTGMALFGCVLTQAIGAPDQVKIVVPISSALFGFCCSLINGAIEGANKIVHDYSWVSSAYFASSFFAINYAFGLPPIIYIPNSLLGGLAGFYFPKLLSYIDFNINNQNLEI
jgi:hypothetical protein